MKKEADKADSAGLICASTKTNQAISMCMVSFKVQPKISKRLELGLCLIIVVKEVL